MSLLFLTGILVVLALEVAVTVHEAGGFHVAHGAVPVSRIVVVAAAM